MTLENFVALNDEIASLLRAGVPLDLGLRGFADGVRGELSDIAGRLSQRLAQGESLAVALESEGNTIPGVYRAAITAGIKAGRLPQATEALSQAGRSLIEVRRSITLGIMYPTIIILLAYYLGWWSLARITPTIVGAVLEPGESPYGWMLTLESIADTFTWLGHIPPLMLFVAVVIYTIRSRRVDSKGGLSSGLIRWIPGVRGFVQSCDLATFAELSSVLLQSGVTTSQSLKLAAETTGNRGIIADVDMLLAHEQRGERISQSVAKSRSLPRLMQWMLGSGDRLGTFPGTFRHLAEIYRRRARHRGELFGTIFPIVVTVVIGGGVVLAYCLSMFIPFIELLKTIGAS